MRRYLFLGIVAAVAAVLAVVPMSALADTGGVLTVGSAGGTNAAVNDVVGASLASGTNATFAVGSGSVTCTSSSFSATVTSNPAASGTANESLTAQSFGGCTTQGVAFVNNGSKVDISAANLPYATTVSSSGSVTVAAVTANVVVHTGGFFGNVNCGYTAANGISGTASNTDNSLTFTNQTFTKSTGSGLCNNSVTLTVKYGPITDSTQGNQAVFTN
jgi:hypothetical protein